MKNSCALCITKSNSFRWKMWQIKHLIFYLPQIWEVSCPLAAGGVYWEMTLIFPYTKWLKIADLYQMITSSEGKHFFDTAVFSRKKTSAWEILVYFAVSLSLSHRGILWIKKEEIFGKCHSVLEFRKCLFRMFIVGNKKNINKWKQKMPTSHSKLQRIPFIQKLACLLRKPLIFIYFLFFTVRFLSLLCSEVYIPYRLYSGKSIWDKDMGWWF